MDAGRTALYRFYDSAKTLLYVGISLDPATRMGQHRSDKDWWSRIANVTVEWHDSHSDALEAERTAILAEGPQHNIAHNKGSGNRYRRTATRPKPSVGAPIRAGQVVALCLRGGECPIGYVEWVSHTYITISPLNFVTGEFDERSVVKRSEIVLEEVYWADWEKDVDQFGNPAPGVTFYHTEKLGARQTAWGLAWQVAVGEITDAQADAEFAWLYPGGKKLAAG